MVNSPIASPAPPNSPRSTRPWNAWPQVDERKARIVELRFFTGLTTEETAEMMGLSPITVYRDLSFATAFLSEQLGAS